MELRGRVGCLYIFSGSSFIPQILEVAALSAPGPAAGRMGSAPDLWLNVRYLLGPTMKLEEQNLLEIFERLAPAQQDMLISFAEFLTARSDEPGAAPGEPAFMPRPAEETVTLAIRRLLRTYPMLDRSKLMAEAAQVMARRALEGRGAREVIDDLEALFARHYQRI